MVGWVASATISRLLTKGFDYLDYDTTKKLAQLEPKILVLERVMQVVETSPDRPRLERLFRELKSAYYEAEEILDAVEYHCLEKQIKTGKLQPGGGSSLPKKDRLKKKVLSFLPFVLCSVSPAFVVPYICLKVLEILAYQCFFGHIMYFATKDT